MTTLEEEPISTLTDPLPLPPYGSDSTLSEDENLLTWVSILARHSSSKKGHMGAIFVRRPESGDPSSSSSPCIPSLPSRIITYANNTPLLFSRHAKSVPEIHAEALAISRCAAKGVPLAGCTVYISFPPCNDCFKLLAASGIKRCVFKKGIPPGESSDAIMVTAKTLGIEMVGTLDQTNYWKQKRDKEAEVAAKAEERKQDDVRDGRVRAFWASQGEDAARTRARVHRWWEDWMQRYRAAERILHGKVKTDTMTQEQDSSILENSRARSKDLESSTFESVPSLVPSKRSIEEDQTALKEAKSNV